MAVPTERTDVVTRTPSAGVGLEKSTHEPEQPGPGLGSGAGERYPGIGWASSVRRRSSTSSRHRWNIDVAKHFLRRDSFAPVLSSRLDKDPGQTGFVEAYILSNWMPIFAASLGPISNLNSIIALVGHWRIDKLTDDSPGDFHWVLSLNALSLFFGCSANIALLLNFSGRVRYTTAQVLSIGGWFIASTLLTALLIATRFVYFHPTSIYSRSSGYWNAVVTCILYALSASMLVCNVLGYVAGKYGASFNLTKNQRSIMVQNVILIVWIGAGGGVFSHLIDINYADGIYYCVVTILTIGLGDIVGKTNLTRALCLPYAFIGVLMLGLIVATIRSIVLEAGGETLLLHRTERSRERYYESLIQDELAGQLDTHGFEEMRLLWKRSRARSQLSSVLYSVFMFTVFLMLGAMVFFFCEPSWSYFDAIYFCCLCLLTIGYGDFVPSSDAGRCFFVVWAIGAVPLMTILISNLGDTLFSSLLQGNNILGDLTLLRSKDRGGTSDGEISDISTELGIRNRKLSETLQAESPIERAVSLCAAVRTSLEMLLDSPEQLYEYAEWTDMLRQTQPPWLERHFEGQNDIRYFWLSETSPLRFPVVEPQLFLEHYLGALERELKQISAGQAGQPNVPDRPGPNDSGGPNHGDGTTAKAAAAIV